MPRLRTSSASAAAHLIARSGWGKVAKKPSPAWSSSFPPKRLREARTSRLKRDESSR